MEKTHIDYAHELDLALRPDSTVPIIGKEYGYFSGPGVPLFSVGGGYMRQALQQILVGFHARRGYYIVETPTIASAELFKLSGHLDFYRENMYIFQIEDREFAIKPMNCPYHLLIFVSHLARYRGKVRFPFKIFEMGRVHRYEPSGSLHGLLRVRGFTQDDAHIVVKEGDLEKTVMEVFDEMRSIMSDLFLIPLEKGTIRIRASLSSKEKIGEHYMGTVEEWEAAEGVIERISSKIAEKHGIGSTRGIGEAAFYGPKIDVLMSLKGSGGVKEWQMGTIQFDFNLPRRFGIYEMVREIFGDVRIFVIHRALIGSIERFLGGYLEHYKGRLPFVLAPLQVALISIKTGGEIDAAIDDLTVKIQRGLISMGIRAGLRETSKTSLTGDVRAIESTVKPPIIIYIGEREVKERTLSLSIYDHNLGKRRNLTISYGNAEDMMKAIAEIIEKEEEGARRLAGSAPRIPADLSHLL